MVDRGTKNIRVKTERKMFEESRKSRLEELCHNKEQLMFGEFGRKETYVERLIM